MKMKRILACMTLAAMAATGTACAEGPGLAARPVEVSDFERYPSCRMDEQTGLWSVRSNQADALLDRFWTYSVNNGARLCAFNLELEGNAWTGVYTPVMRFYIMNGKKIDASAVTLLADGVRYTFAARSSEVEREGRAAECISAPLTGEALEAVRAIAGAQEVSLRLIGERSYTAELDRETTNSRRRIEAAALLGLEDACALLDEIGLPDYGLWDLSAAAWETQYGFAPMFERGEVVYVIGETDVTDDFGMVMVSDQSRAAKPAQQLLIDSGFMSGSASSTFTGDAAAAAKRAQRYLGRIETGAVDAGLAAALEAGVQEAAAVEAVLAPLGDVAEAAIDRWWFADGVSAVSGPESLRTVFNSDNTFLICDGVIRNVSAEELRLFTGVDARIICNDAYAYEATVVCERNGGSELDMALLPLAQARLLVYAEVPEGLAQQDVSWRVELRAGDGVLEYELK